MALIFLNADDVESFRRSQQQREILLNSLPRLTEEDIISLGHRGTQRPRAMTATLTNADGFSPALLEPTDSQCPICFNSLLALLTEEEMALAMDSPAYSVENLGVTQLRATCGHIFCRKDLSKWIIEERDSCPMCRRAFFSSPSDNPGAPPQRPVSWQDTLPPMHDAESLLDVVASLGGTSPSALPRRTTVDGNSDDPPHEHGGMYS